MPSKINRILIPFIILIFLSLGKQTITTGQSPANNSFLPIVSYNLTGWIGPYSGTIVGVAIDPINPQVIYAGSYGSGVYKSTDGGNTWYSFNRGLSNLFVYSLAIDPLKSETLYAGTYRSQVYKSQDGGKSWTWSGTGMQEQAVVYAIVVDPVTPATIYACTRGVSNNGSAPWNGVVYKSTDAGQTWSPSLTNVGGAEQEDWVYSLAINPNSPNQVFAAAHENGPFRSDDYGTTWHSIHNGIIDHSGRAIAISPQPEHSSILYHGVWHFDSVYKSINSGEIWTQADQDYPEAKVYSIAIDPYSVDTVYMATFSHGLLKTSDGGNHWQSVELQRDRFYSVVINLWSTNNLFISTSGDGLYRSMDSGNSWEHINTGINNAMVTALVHSPINASTIFTSLYGGGILESTNRGQTWAEINTGIGDKFVHDLIMDPAHPDQLFALTDTGGLYKNDLDNGAVWFSVGGGLPLTQNPMPAFSTDHPFATLDMQEAFATPQENLSPNQATNVNLLKMVFAPSNAQIAYIGTHGSGVYRSNNGGLNWSPAGLGGQTILSLAVDPADANLVYAATEISGSLWVSTDGGKSWNNIFLPVFFYSVFTSPTESGVVYAGTSSGVFRYQSGNWVEMGLSNQIVTVITAHPVKPGVFYAGTTSGAYYTTDNGQSWKYVDTLLSGQTIQSISFDRAIPNVVYFSTKTHGIFLAAIQF
jgi:photosystem II stability/assembly factor-like uncharacterized protein